MSPIKVHISNLSEDVWPFISRLPTKIKKQEIKENAWLSDREVLSSLALKVDVLILPRPIDRNFLRYCGQLLHNPNLIVLVPRRHSGQICLDILSDAKIIHKLKSWPDIILTSYSASPQFYALVEYLKNKLKIRVVTPESPAPFQQYTVDLFGSKGGLRQVIQALPSQKSWLQMPPGLVFDQLTAASTYGALEYVKNGGVVLKTYKGHAGLGVAIFKPGSLPNNIPGATVAILHHLRQEGFWSGAPLIVEKYLEIDTSQAGGCPSIEVQVDHKGKVKVLYWCGMRVSDSGVFGGIEIHQSLLPAKQIKLINRIGQTLGRLYARSGYRGYFDVDLAIDQKNQIYITESNVRRTGGTHVYHVAKKLLGINFPQNYFVLSNNSLPLPFAKKISFHRVLQQLNAILFNSQTRSGLILASAGTLKNDQLAYIIIAPDQLTAYQLEKKMTGLLQNQV